MIYKDHWLVLGQIGKAVYDDSPWGQLLAHYGSKRNAPQSVCPCPAVWRSPPTGAVSDGWAKESRWDWRDCKQERTIRLALQSRKQMREPAFGLGFGRETAGHPDT